MLQPGKTEMIRLEGALWPEYSYLHQLATDLRGDTEELKKPTPYKKELTKQAELVLVHRKERRTRVGTPDFLRLLLAVHLDSNFGKIHNSKVRIQASISSSQHDQSKLLIYL
jgi:hypothetical protein